MDSACESQTSPTLLGRLKNLRDEQAWKEFVHRYAPRIYDWCRGLGLQDADAQEITQGVLVKLAVRMQTFDYDPNGSFRGWLRTVTINAWKAFLASRRRHGQAVGGARLSDWWQTLEAAEDLADHLDEELEQEQLDEAMARVQRRVGVRTWKVFCLLVFEERRGAEVAKKFGMTLSAVYGARHRVQTLLQKEVQRLQRSGAS
jgi:RNA polymerase sigma factor (sigma-70 family)